MTINENGMRNILKYLIVALLLGACEKEKIVMLDLDATKDEISRIELRADHKILRPDGIAKVEFYPVVYGKKVVDLYNKNEENEYVAEKTEIEYLIPNDILPPNYVKVYDSNDNELIDNIYSTETGALGEKIEFYAKAGNVESNRLTVTLREIPDESYEELVIPVIFHFLLPPTVTGPAFDVSVEYLESVLKRTNDILNRRVTSDPNGGNAKITLKLALYNNAGIRLEEAGKHVVQLSSSNMSLIGSYADQNSSSLGIAYNKFIMRYRSSYLWDPNKYLNIWVARKSGSGDYYDLAASQSEFPKVIHSDYSTDAIPGLKNLAVVDNYVAADVNDCLEVGIILNYESFLSPTTNYSLARIFGRYCGLFYTDQNSNNNIVDGDNDYCADTYLYYSGYGTGIFKNNRLYRESEDAEYEWFTSFNVMDNYSRKNSITIDQALRMRQVLKSCPSRWTYKSDWAFTGK